MTDHTYALRKTWPDAENDYLGIDENGDRIARIMWNVGVTPPRWQYSVGIGTLPQLPTFRGDAATLDEAKAKVKELWPLYRAQWSDEEYEKGLRLVREADERASRRKRTPSSGGDGVE